MTAKQNLKYQLIAASSGFAFELLFTICWGGFGHNLPPASPNFSGPELASYFALNHNSILFGQSMAALIAVLWIPWTAQLTVVLWRIEGSSPVLTIIELIGGVLTAWVLMFCPAIWATAAFRPNIDPNSIRLLNDLGFILFNITYAVTSVQAIAAGLVGLADHSEHPIFPRWVCGWAIFAGLSFIPLTAMPFFKTGPIAWNGLLSFWTLFGTYFIWTASMGYCMVKDANRRLHDQDEVTMVRQPVAGRVDAA